MLELVQDTQSHMPRQNTGRAVLRYRTQDTERTAGSMPVWERRHDDAQSEIAGNLDAATAGTVSDPFASALSYAAQDDPASSSEQEFGFGDLVDMINPLQHIPFLNQLYRNVTGDDIKPISRIIGGGIYGGPIGGAAALTNVAVEYETGKGVPGNVMAMLADGDKPSFRSTPDQPEQRLETATRSMDAGTVPPDMPGNVLSFTDLGGGQRRVVERFVSDDVERTAGTMVRHYTYRPAETLSFLPPRTPITTLTFAALAEEEGAD